MNIQTQSISPQFNADGFNCPHCNAFSEQKRSRLHSGNNGMVAIGTCERCKNISIRFGENQFTSIVNMVYPNSTGITAPNQDLDEEIQNDYLEASEIVKKSPRGACALLRLGLQKLMVQLGESGKDINSDIGSLVSKGLNPMVQQALDTVRVIGNEAVHPGEIDMRDNKEIAMKIFGLINVIADYMITQPKKIQELYGTLPEGKLKGIQNRDKTTS